MLYRVRPRRNFAGMPFRNKQYQVTASGRILEWCIYTADGMQRKVFHRSPSVDSFCKSLNAIVHLIPHGLHCATLHGVINASVHVAVCILAAVLKHGTLRRFRSCYPRLHQTWYSHVAIYCSAEARGCSTFILTAL